METGTVKFFNAAKGFGFISDNESGTDVFVHASGLNGNIREDDAVEFETEQGKKGKSAINVSLADSQECKSKHMGLLFFFYYDAPAQNN